jgi:hypothetical protein
MQYYLIGPYSTAKQGSAYFYARDIIDAFTLVWLHWPDAQVGTVFATHDERPEDCKEYIAFPDRAQTYVVLPATSPTFPMRG